MQFEQQQQLPPLIPIKKKKQAQSNYTPQTDEKAKNLQTTQPKTQQRSKADFTQQSKLPQDQTPKRSSNQQKQVPKTPKQLQDKKIESFSQKFKNIQQKSTTQKKSMNKKSEEQKKEQNQKSKFFIAEMLNKISVKNISQELYPITNETIQTVIYQMEEQIKGYKTEAQKKQNTLLTNPNNQHLKQQIANLEKSIDHCSTIKELYQEKINFRNKIAILEGKIIQLRAQNRDLKIKVSRGIQKIQNHMHSLPCDNEKQLIQKLNKTEDELRKQKQMRVNLEKNIQDIIMNFKRLYEEADTARLIVTKKLKQIQERERRINEEKFESLMQGDDQNSNSKRSPKLQPNDDKRSPKPKNPHESQSSTQRYRHSKPERQQRMQRDRDRQRPERQGQRTRKQNKNQDQRKPMSFEESIKKMRGNQAMLSKIYNRG